MAIRWKCWVCGWRATTAMGGHPFDACRWCAPRLGPDPDVFPPYAVGDVWTHPQYGSRTVVAVNPLSWAPIGLAQGELTTWWEAKHMDRYGWRRFALVRSA